MHFINVVVTAGSIFGASLAAPIPQDWAHWGNPESCMTPDIAANLVSGYAGLISGYQQSNADQYLTVDFTDISDSINELAHIPLGSTTFATKAAFEQTQATQPAVGFQILNIDAVICDTIAFRWQASLGANPVKGIIIMKTVNTDGTETGWKIREVYNEFNSIAWLQDIGGSVTFPRQ